MTKEFLQAIRDLPEEYVTDTVAVCEFAGAFICADPALPPIIYRNGQWEFINDPQPKPTCTGSAGVVH